MLLGLKSASLQVVCIWKTNYIEHIDTHVLVLLAVALMTMGLFGGKPFVEFFCLFDNNHLCSLHSAFAWLEPLTEWVQLEEKKNTQKNGKLFNNLKYSEFHFDYIKFYLTANLIYHCWTSDENCNLTAPEMWNVIGMLNKSVVSIEDRKKEWVHRHHKPFDLTGAFGHGPSFPSNTDNFLRVAGRESSVSVSVLIWLLLLQHATEVTNGGLPQANKTPQTKLPLSL